MLAQAAGPCRLLQCYWVSTQLGRSWILHFGTCTRTVLGQPDVSALWQRKIYLLLTQGTRCPLLVPVTAVLLRNLLSLAEAPPLQ